MALLVGREGCAVVGADECFDKFLPFVQPPHRAFERAHSFMQLRDGVRVGAGTIILEEPCLENLTEAPRDGEQQDEAAEQHQ